MIKQLQPTISVNTWIYRPKIIYRFFPGGIIHPVVSVAITGSITLLMDYYSRRYQPPSSQCYYHWVDTSAGGLLFLGGIIHPVVSVTITGSIPLLVDYFSRRYHPPSSQCCYHWVITSADGLSFPEGIIHPVVSVTINGPIPLLVDYQSPKVSSSQQSMLISLVRYLCWWTISPRR